ncbi:MAG: A/G-specific adenine glycosylase [SAR324 cluster bacterium]|nr:A/G-specific adenine glycosylase [SAR324 cluster bacterium]
MTPEQLPDLQHTLLGWFAEHQRPLPWRRRCRPYEIWVSEIMLQQTQVKTMLPFYTHWMAELPSVRSVAEAPEEVVLKLWEGLGYYSRAHNLQKAAQVICGQHGGVFPEDFEQIRALPGIGPYTAGAIASIAFNQPRPVVDGNVERVLCRIEGIAEPPKSTPVQKRLWALAAEWIPHGHARDFNQGLMELGATVCTPRNPSCLLCPVNAWCVAFQTGRTDAIPAPRTRPKPTKIAKITALTQCGNRWLVRKRPEGGLMGGLWEFPTWEEPPAEGSTAVWLATQLCAEYGVDAQIGPELFQMEHGYTRFQATLHCWICTVAEIPDAISTNARWLTLDEIAELALPRVFQRLRKRLLDESST